VLVKFKGDAKSRVRPTKKDECVPSSHGSTGCFFTACKVTLRSGGRWDAISIAMPRGREGCRGKDLIWRSKSVSRSKRMVSCCLRMGWNRLNLETIHPKASRIRYAESVGRRRSRQVNKLSGKRRVWRIGWLRSMTCRSGSGSGST
jgi:hypothetical protein